MKEQRGIIFLEFVSFETLTASFFLNCHPIVFEKSWWLSAQPHSFPWHPLILDHSIPSHHSFLSHRCCQCSSFSSHHHSELYPSSSRWRKGVNSSLKSVLQCNAINHPEAGTEEPFSDFPPKIASFLVCRFFQKSHTSSCASTLKSSAPSIYTLIYVTTAINIHIYA